MRRRGRRRRWRLHSLWSCRRGPPPQLLAPPTPCRANPLRATSSFWSHPFRAGMGSGGAPERRMGTCQARRAAYRRRRFRGYVPRRRFIKCWRRKQDERDEGKRKTPKVLEMTYKRVCEYSQMVGGFAESGIIRSSRYMVYSRFTNNVSACCRDPVSVNTDKPFYVQPRFVERFYVVLYCFFRFS